MGRGAFQVGDIVASKAHPGEWLVNFAGMHSEGHPILTVEAVDDHSCQFFDLQKNFILLRRSPPISPAREGES